jgi:hypothetical protein
MKKKQINKIPFKCPYENFSCPYVDQVKIIALKKCIDCEYNKKINKNGNGSI